jgi:HK97 family phage portal protein
MGRIADYLRGRDLEDRTLTRGAESETFPYVPPTSTTTSLPAISESAALRIADIFACVRVLANAIGSLPPRVYRRLPDGSRTPAGEDQRLVALLRRPEPGSTSADLLGSIMVHLLVHGDAFLAKYRREDSIVQIALLDPQTVTVERDGERIIYGVSRREGISEHSPADILHVKAMSQDGLRGISTVRAAAKVLQVNEGLVAYAANFLGNAARPGGILSVTGDVPLPNEHAQDLKQDWQELFSAQGSSAGAGKIAVFSGDMNFEAVEPAMKDSEFTEQRRLAAQECARAFGLPAWAIDAPSGDSMTYGNVTQTNRYLVDHAIRPWATRIERAFSNDSDLCPGGVYLALDFDSLLRADPEARANYYTAALDGGWLTRDEIRAAEDLPRLEAASNE